MTRFAILKTFAASVAIFTTIRICAQERQAPAYPLITHNTYFSIWSTTDQLNASTTQHWTGADNSLLGLIKVDGRIFRFMGRDKPNYKTVVSATDEAGYTVRYSEAQPQGDWTSANFNDADWKSGQAPIGDNEKTAKTSWRSNHIWVRRSFTITNLSGINELFLKLNHDDNIEVFLNGKKVYNKLGWTNSFRFHPINKADLITGRNVIAIHLENTAGGRFLDFGLVDKAKDNSDNIALAEQKQVAITATQTSYDFTCGNIDLKLTFTSPLLLNDRKLLARPVSYITYAIKANDEKKHNATIFLGASSDIAVYQPAQQVSTRKYTAGGLSILKTGTLEQPVLQKKSDDMRIDWGYFYVAVPQSFGARQFITKSADAARAFDNGAVASTAATGKSLSLNTIIPISAVGKDPVERHVLLGYDELYSIQYFNTNLRPWWNNDGRQTIEGQLTAAAKEYKTVMEQCTAFNKELNNKATKAGGDRYAHLCELAYRQSIAAHTLVKSPEGEILWLSKENNSGGFINTVDVTYPSAPLYLLYNPDLVQGMLNGIFHFSETGKYNHPWAAHDLGTYPIANGQTYGEPMPVEESGNMIILTAAIAKVQGNANYAKLHWKTLTNWVDYLTKEGLDPKTQLCTDDFAGHLARNANLSVKAIVAIACYAQLAEQLGETGTAKKYRAIAESMVPQWITMADAGDHYSLTFDNKETWSQKYNLIWDKVLNLHLFPQKVYDTETQYYLTKQQKFGLPLDSRKTYTKNDWILWTATFAPQQDQFEKLITPVYHHALETESRVPLNDFYDAITGIRENFKARSVVGGFFMKILADSMQGK
ncbi:glutaminase [Niastella yeongjuensis]|uniref:Glutaminase n=1 Tax=Niastella yeongjuensis TaxID=354355 RepID=A0A1V9EQ88_9BACT|nr:glutaminase family protein [Niastella yeongjuensis]OQP48104.1 glutaminase [Niastella yeongjuensis]SEO23680.1 protein of unknown function [Niastella yeongjuensis]